MYEAQTQTSWASVKAQLILIKNVLNENHIIILNNIHAIITFLAIYTFTKLKLWCGICEDTQTFFFYSDNYLFICSDEDITSTKNLYLFLYTGGRWEETWDRSPLHHRIKHTFHSHANHSITVVTATDKRGFLWTKIKSDNEKRQSDTAKIQTLIMRTTKMWMRQGQESVCTQITIMIFNEQLGKNLQRRYVSAQIYFKKEKKGEN